MLRHAADTFDTMQSIWEIQKTPSKYELRVSIQNDKVSQFEMEMEMKAKAVERKTHTDTAA